MVPALRWIVFGLLSLAGTVLLLGGLATVGTQEGVGVVLLGLGILVAAGAWYLWPARVRHGAELTVVVREDRIEMWRPGDPPQVVERHEAALVVLRVEGARGYEGLTQFEVFGPDRSLLGSWETNWYRTGPVRSIRALGYHGYPWFLYNTSALSWSDQRHAERVPPWAREVLTPR